jgi:hypothetical protein
MRSFMLPEAHEIRGMLGVEPGEAFDDQEVGRMFEWLATPATALALGVVLTCVAVLIVAIVAVVLGVCAVYMRPGRADRALAVVRELRLLVAALRGVASRSGVADQ